MDDAPHRCLLFVIGATAIDGTPAQGIFALDCSALSKSIGLDLMDTLDAIDADHSSKRSQRWLAARQPFLPLLEPALPGARPIKASLLSLPRAHTSGTASLAVGEWRLLTISEAHVLSLRDAIAAVDARLDLAMSLFGKFGARVLERPSTAPPGPGRLIVPAAHAMARDFLHGLACSAEREELGRTAPDPHPGSPAPYGRHRI